MKWLKGRKTYITGAAWLAWGAWLFLVDGDQAAGAQKFLEGLSLLTLRAGVSKAAAAMK